VTSDYVPVGFSLRERVNTLNAREYYTEVPRAELGRGIEWQPVLRVEWTGEVIWSVEGEALDNLPPVEWLEALARAAFADVDMDRLQPYGWDFELVMMGRGIVARPKR
jgi:hypothetical protein